MKLNGLKEILDEATADTPENCKVYYYIESFRGTETIQVTYDELLIPIPRFGKAPKAPNPLTIIPEPRVIIEYVAGKENKFLHYAGSVSCSFNNNTWGVTNRVDPEYYIEKFNKWTVLVDELSDLFDISEVFAHYESYADRSPVRKRTFVTSDFIYVNYEANSIKGKFSKSIKITSEATSSLIREEHETMLQKQNEFVEEGKEASNKLKGVYLIKYANGTEEICCISKEDPMEPLNLENSFEFIELLNGNARVVMLDKVQTIEIDNLKDGTRLAGFIVPEVKEITTGTGHNTIGRSYYNPCVQLS